MDVKERQKIYDLLSQYFPHARQVKDPKTRTAWGLALAQFPYEAVKNAVVAYAISNKYFPDLADITGALAPDSGARRTAPATLSETHGPRTAQAMRVQAAWRTLYQEALSRELARLGLRAFSGATGADYIAWTEHCLAAGLDIPTLLETTRLLACSAGEAEP